MPADIERRTKARFPIELNVRYRSRSASTCEHNSGFGRTLNISSTGLLIASEHPAPEGTLLDIVLEWPCLLDDTTPIQLVAHSRVVRADQSRFAVALVRYEFRTRSRQTESMPRNVANLASAALTACEPPPDVMA
jgi:PilZ domain-containing protein